MSEKPCTKCGEVKDINLFCKDRSKRDGRQSKCKECMALYVKNLSPEAKALRYKSSRKWIENNKVKYKEIKDKWDRENPRYSSDYSARYYIENKERKLESSRIWYKNNREAARAIDHRRRARKLNAKGSHTKEDILFLLKMQKYSCAYCLSSIKDDYTVDHINAISKGGSDDKYNLQILCRSCNSSKGAKEPITFMQERGFLL